MHELDVSRERLAALLRQGAESKRLEFVADCDLSDRRDIVELATELARSPRRAARSSSVPTTTATLLTS